MCAESSNQDIASLAKKYALLNAVGHDGRADQGAVIGRILAERSELRKEAKRVSAIVREQASNVNSLSKEEQIQILHEEFGNALEKELQRKKEISKAESEKKVSLPELPGAVVGDVVTRFPPEPNGYMHIGHAKAALIDSEYAKKYQGRFILRFDDTNPAAEKKEYYDAFLESMDWLGIKPDTIKNSSDDVPKLYELAEKMILRQKSYVCTCAQEEMRRNRNEGIDCACRSRNVEENLSLWKKMIGGEIAKRNATLRFAGDMKSPNTTMRDPVLFRIVLEPHPLKGSQYSVWPTYDFDGPVEDSLDGVTHAMRSKEYELRDELYYSILNALDLREPKIIEFSRLSLQNTTVSKRSLRKLIQDGLVQGWDDPRLPTISGLRRRGFVPAAIKEFILSMGVSKVESEPTWDLLESINRKILDPIAKRYFFVPDPIPLRVRGAPRADVRLKYHPEKDYGERIISTDGNFLVPRADVTNLRLGSKLRLIEAYNVQIESFSGEEVLTSYIGEERAESMPKIQWVDEKSHLKLQVVVTGPLLLNDTYNPESMKITNGVTEAMLGSIGIGELVQFVRFGFCRMDAPGIAILAHK